MHNARNYGAKTCPPAPDGLTPRMAEYQWFSKVKGWHPQIVDELTLEQIAWFHIMEEASDAAAEYLQKMESS